MSAKYFLTALAQVLAQEGLDTWQGMNEEAPMEQADQAYLIYQISLHLQRMNAESVRAHFENPF